MAITTGKVPTDLDASQTQQHAYNETDKSFTVSSFITAKVGHRIDVTHPDGTTDDYEFFDVSTSLYKLRLIFDNVAHDNLVSVERIS